MSKGSGIGLGMFLHSFILYVCLGGFAREEACKLAIATSEGFFPEVQQTLFSEVRPKTLFRSSYW